MEHKNESEFSLRSEGSEQHSTRFDNIDYQVQISATTMAEHSTFHHHADTQSHEFNLILESQSEA